MSKIIRLTSWLMFLLALSGFCNSIYGQSITSASGIVKDSNSCLLTHELQEMTAGLKVLRAGIRDRYESDFQEGFYFSVSARAAGEDAFALDVSFYLPNTMDGDDTAEIACAMTGAELTALIDELDRLCERFPDRT